ncbi:Outer membrane porin protein (plasmid) [Caballeronia sp. SBC1]|uniref:porin n=1 Tax=unclassified Caballeronia TaxID=2646786 RepID=UPI0013E1380A|nr:MULTISPECIES: porin [unclassified Caballeronia]QIE28753.1 Outer membrane porin protein [Caballeronia sp. SBC2]QIN66808.1 Outer membrane porin protein [Caballeronia sp. SBC1]
MKRFALTSLSLALLGTAGVAHAQNSVTLYGVIDAGLSYVNHASGNEHLVAANAGTLSGDRWGLKGQEDLGGGLKAIFQLENGFNTFTGGLNQGGREFGRQAFVGLTADKLGTVTLGRQYDPLVDMVQGITGDNYWASIVGTPGDVDNYDNSSRVNNAVKYVSPNYAGLQFEGMYGFSNGAGTTGQGQTWSGAVAYNNGPLGLAGGYYYTNNPTAGRVTPATATTDASGNWNGSSDNIVDSAINAGYVSAHSIAIARAAAQYAIGPVTVGASYSNAQYTNDGHSIFTSKEKYNIGSVFANYQVTPAFLVGAGYTYEKASGDTSATYNQVGVGADYTLSKRTDFYAVGAYQHASGTQALNSVNPVTGVRNTQAAQASIGSFGYNGTSTQELVIVGIRHKF